MGQRVRVVIEPNIVFLLQPKQVAAEQQTTPVKPEISKLQQHYSGRGQNMEDNKGK
jgi:hypothetical protein